MQAVFDKVVRVYPAIFGSLAIVALLVGVPPLADRVVNGVKESRALCPAVGVDGGVETVESGAIGVIASIQLEAGFTTLPNVASMSAIGPV